MMIENPGYLLPRYFSPSHSKELDSVSDTMQQGIRINPVFSPSQRPSIAQNTNSLAFLSKQDEWLPITESRRGNAYYAAFHTLSSGIGFQALVLPFAFVALGWSWGIISLILAFVWQLYTIWLLIQMHEPVPGTRYSRYLHLAIAAFGAKLGKLLALFPIMYLSGGTCVLLIMMGGGTMKTFFHIISTSNTKTLTTVEWPSSISYGPLEPKFGLDKLCYVLNGLGIVAFAFRGHNLVLEIQGTMPTSTNHPSSIPMWRAVKFSYLVIAMCLFPLAVGGYWAYGNLIPSSGGILSALDTYHNLDTPKLVLGFISLLIVVNCLTSFQIYSMPVFDYLEFKYTSSTKKPCPRWLRAVFRICFGCFAFFISVALPFLPSLAGLIGGMTLPLTLAYPCFMWIMIKKPTKYSTMWVINWGLGCLGMILSIMLVFGAIGNIVIHGMEIHFFKPK